MFRGVAISVHTLLGGEATFWFGKHGSLDRILLQGRWMAARMARTYLNEGLAVLTEMKKSRLSFELCFTMYIPILSVLRCLLGLKMLERSPIEKEWGTWRGHGMSSFFCFGLQERDRDLAIGMVSHCFPSIAFYLSSLPRLGE